MTDKTLRCRDCGADFTFTASEQSFYAEKGFTNEPARCPGCRAARKDQQRGGGREMYTAICAQCGREATVPFRPSNDKPVYCKDCFQPQGRSNRY